MQLSTLVNLVKVLGRLMIKISSTLSWKLGLKLPKSYDFFYLSSHGVGHNAMLGFLHHCGVQCNWHFAESGKQRYCNLYHMLIKAKYSMGGATCYCPK